MKRHLRITRRRIPLDRLEDYARLWHQVCRVVANADGRAWLFNSQGASDQFIEFVEWVGDEAHPLIERAEIADAINALAAAFSAKDSETWIETKI